MFKPMLASPVDFGKLRFPVLASPKLDGIRATVRDGVLWSRKNIAIPNLYCQALFGKYEFWDGELIVGPPTATDVCRRSMSGCMSVQGEPEVTFHVFDHIAQLSVPYISRCHLPQAMPAHTARVAQMHIDNMADLDSYEEAAVAVGYEGVMLRDPWGVYKLGRSTANEGTLLKLKRFEDAEFEVIGFTERMHNGNEATVGELGQTKRSSHQENKTGRGDLGALMLKHGDLTFQCGTGFDDTERAALWAVRNTLTGRYAKIKYLAVGMKNLPRHPVFLGFRDRRD